MNKRALGALPLLGLSALAATLSGCGGASTSSGGISAPTLASGPVIYGVNAAAANSGTLTGQGETSGLTFTDPTSGATFGALIGATGYHTTNGAGPLPVYQLSFPNSGTTSSPGLPLGFSPDEFAAGGAYYLSSGTVAAIPTTYTGNLTFGAYVSTGTFNSKPADLNTTSIVLTSSEDSTFSVPLTYDPNFGTGILAQAQYKTAPFAIPAFLKTTGLHNLHTTVADVAGQSSTTDFSVLSLAPTDSAALVSVAFSYQGTLYAVPGATATITNPNPTVPAYKAAGATAGLPAATSYSDTLGNVLLFAAPGTQTVTVSGISPIDGTTAVSGTVQVTLVAGQVNTSKSITTTATATAPAAAIARYKQLYHLVKH